MCAFLNYYSEFSHPMQPISLPALVGSHTHQSRRPNSSLPQTPQYGSGSTKLGTHLLQDSAQASNYMIGNIMPFGNPSLTAQNKSGSDICLNLPEGRDGQKNSVSSTGLYNPGGNLSLGNELNWLDLDNTSSLATLQASTFGGSNLSSHSNPGSLPHDQFHTFIEDGMNAQVGMLESLGKNSNPTVNGFGLGGVPGGGGGGGMPSYLEAGVLHQSGLYPTDDERLLELGLSTS